MGHIYAAFIRFVLTKTVSLLELVMYASILVSGLPWWQLLIGCTVTTVVTSCLQGIHSDILDDEETFDDSDVLIEFDTAENTYTATRLSDGVIIARGPDAESLATDMIRKLKR